MPSRRECLERRTRWRGSESNRQTTSSSFELDRFPDLRTAPANKTRNQKLETRKGVRSVERHPLFSSFWFHVSGFPSASPMGFEPTISCLTGRRALHAAPRGRISFRVTKQVAQVGFEPTASLVLSESGLPVAYRAGGKTRNQKLETRKDSSARRTSPTLF
jgi:hypothetical protein